MYCYQVIRPAFYSQAALSLECEAISFEEEANAESEEGTGDLPFVTSAHQSPFNRDISFF